MTSYRELSKKLFLVLFKMAVCSLLLISACKDIDSLDSELKNGGQGLGSGNGGMGQQYINMWFPGSEPVRYCIQVAPSGSFSLPLKDARSAINDALTDWAKAVALQQTLWVPPYSFVEEGRVPLATKFTESETCDKDIDLVFKLGIIDEEMRQYLQQHQQLSAGSEDSPVAMAFPRSRPTTALGRTRGEIWFTPDEGPDRYKGKNATATIADRFWAVEHNFFNVVLHEIGHTFGFPHDRSNLMAAHEPLAAISLKTNPQPRLSAVDLFRLNPLRQPPGLCKLVATGKAELGPNVLSKYFNIADIKNLQLCFEARSEKPWVFGGVEGTYQLKFRRGEGAAGTAVAETLSLTMTGATRHDRQTSRVLFNNVLSYATWADFRGTLTIGSEVYPAIITAKSMDCQVQLAFFANGTWEELVLFDRDLDQLCGLAHRGK